MKDFEYLQPTTIQEACSMLSEHGSEAKVMAGGVSLLTLMKQKLVQPKYVVSLDGIPNLRYINLDNGGLRIGALTTHRAIEKSASLAEKWPILTEMASNIGSVQVRNLGTLGGNICHAEPASDPPAVLVALDAAVKLVSSSGEKVVPMEEFLVDFYETAISSEEILTEIQIAEQAPGTRGAYIKFNPRSAMDLPVVVVVAFVVPGKGAVKDVRIGLGAVSPRAIRARRSEEVLKSKGLTEEAIKEAGQLASEDIDPVSDIRGSADYRREVTKVLVARALNRIK
ncbi:MAG: xanthine dehydrogenase family protein subunit M [Thermodesulfobacteriota bacterium]